MQTGVNTGRWCPAGRGPLSTHPAPYCQSHVCFGVVSGPLLLLFPNSQISSSLSLGIHTLISATIILEALYVLNCLTFSWSSVPLATVFRLLIKSRVFFFFPQCSADWGCELIFEGSMLEKMNVVYFPGYSNPVTENSRRILESSQGSCGLGIHCPVVTW